MNERSTNTGRSCAAYSPFATGKTEKQAARRAVGPGLRLGKLAPVAPARGSSWAGIIEMPMTATVARGRVAAKIDLCINDAC